MKYKHYAPKAQVTILRGDFAKYKEFIKQHTEPGRLGRSALTGRAHSWACRSSSTEKTMTA